MHKWYDIYWNNNIGKIVTLPNKFLASYIPNRHGQVMKVDFLDVETHSGDGGHIFIQFQLEQNRGLAGRIKAKHGYFGPLRPEHFLGHQGQQNTHISPEARPNWV